MAHSPRFQALTRILGEAHRRNQPDDRLAKLPIAPWTRRRFLRLAALSFASAIATTTLSGSPQVQSQTPSPRIAIVGGGIAGLNAAYQLKKQGYQATVYEARPRLGGRIHTRRDVLDRGIYLDFGGLFVNSEHEDLLTLVDEFNLSTFNLIVAADSFSVPATAYYFADRYVTEAELAEQLRPLARQIAVDAALLEEDFSQFAPKLDRLSVADYLKQHSDKISSSLIRSLIKNAIRSEYGVENWQSSALQLIFLLPTVTEDSVEVLGSSDEAYIVNGGSGRIIDGLAQALSGQIQTRKPLTQLEKFARGFRLTFADKEVVEADYTILAMPMTTLRRVELNVELPIEFRQFIEEVNLGNNSKFFALFQEKVWQPNHFSQEIWTDFGYSMAWDSTVRIPRRKNGVLTFFHGGNDVAKARKYSLRNYGEKLIDTLEDAVPNLKSAASERFASTDWSKDLYALGAYTNFQPEQLTRFAKFFYLESDVAEERQNVAFGNLVFAGEQFSDEFYGYMNGGAQTGRLAAEVILQKIRQSS
ncbi:MAG: FAD-dependent oxidoreductase [Pleurocapsa sp. MO_226.B13]|nr:FAD-dependent oxidoreductase [Pleurocapsa sp. MO_226.B13]